MQRPSTSLAAAISLGSFLLLLASCASKPTAPTVAIDDFCSDPRIVVETHRQDPTLQPMGQPSCKSSKVAFRHGGELTDIPVAQVFRGFAQSYDMIWGVTDSIIRLPDESLVNLGHVAPVPFEELLKSHLVATLDMRVGAAVPQSYQFDRFYTAVLEATEYGYCMSYEMKPPFAGQLSQCSRMYPFSGEVSYMPGATTWQEAEEIACRSAGSPSRCSIYSMSFAANAKSEPVYVVELLVEGKRLYYVVEAMTGIPHLRGQRLPSDPAIPVDALLEQI